MKNQIDITKMANAMHKERELQAQIDLEREISPEIFEEQFQQIFMSDETFEREPKINPHQALFDAGHKMSDF